MPDKFTHNEPATPAELYLQEICKKTFLSLWSYPGLYKSPGDELCDLLVIFGNDIIIFSDKYCKFPNSGNLEKDWERWFKRAVYRSARQAWGAERWIRLYPDRIYSDNKATVKFPFALPNSVNARYHLVVVAHDGARRCKEVFGGSGSMLIDTFIQGQKQHTTPFYIGDLDKSKSFIHVLDDTTLNILLNKLDTITDFVSYLVKKEKLLRSNITVLAAGEEELLAVYFKKINKEGEHDFIFPNKDKFNSISIDEGFWSDYIKSDTFHKQLEADRISYVWDRLIERFSHHALTGTQYKVSEPGLQSTEKILRLMAKESRVKRRMLSKILMDLLKKTPANKQMCRIFGPPKPGTDETTYVFLLVPQNKDIIESEYREFRGGLLEAWCNIAKIRFPHAQAIVGIATQPDINDNVRSEDAVYFDASEWNEELQKRAEDVFEIMKLKKDVVLNHYHENEYPELVNNDPRALTVKIPKNARNKPCPCGSGKKYKKCHGK